MEASEVFRKLDAVIDLSKYLSKSDIEAASPPLRMSNVIATCQAEQSIFHLLSDNNLFHINDLERISILSDQDTENVVAFADLRQYFLLTLEEQVKLENITTGNLSSYHSIHYLGSVCKQFTPIPLPAMANQIRKLANGLYTVEGGFWRTRANLFTAARFLDSYHKEIVLPMHSIYDSLKHKLNAIDELILYNNLDFGSSISVLLNAIIKAEKFIKMRGKDYISSLMANLTQFTHEQVNDYIDMVITEANTNVGLCEPLTHIYYRSVNVICGRLVDPIVSR